MGWFSKKKDKVPELPPSPTLPEMPKESNEVKKELPELPSFPAHSNNNINQEMVKSAVGDSPPPGENEVTASIPNDIPLEEGGEKVSPNPLLPEVPKLKPEDKDLPGSKLKPEEGFSIPTPPKVEGYHDNQDLSDMEPRPKKKSIPNLHEQDHNEPIFIRLDKFNASQKNFDTIKEKVKSIESTLEKIKEVRSREDEEIKDWAKEVENMKSGLTKIDSEIFEQI